LIKHGCVPRKSLILEFPTTVPEHLLKHFIRGYSDGDGCIYWGYNKYKTNVTSEWSILGTKEFLMGIRVLLNNELNIDAHLRKRNNVYEIRISRISDFKKSLEWLYKDIDITLLLQRKMDKFESWKNARKIFEIELDKKSTNYNCECEAEFCAKGLCRKHYKQMNYLKSRGENL